MSSLRFDQVAFLYTHNAYNVRGAHRLPNQNLSVARQLDLGVRGLMLDVHLRHGEVVLYHGKSILGHHPLQADLIAIKAFLDTHPLEVMSIIFESYIDAAQLATALRRAGLLPYLHAQTLDAPWPQLGEMYASGKRLVIFSEKDQGNPYPWLHHIWDFATENHYTNHSRADFSTQFNRGDTTNVLYLLNNFITHRKFGVGMQDSAIVANDKDFILARCQQLLEKHDRFANFVAVDFVDIGEAKAAVDALNLQRRAALHARLQDPSADPQEITLLQLEGEASIGRPSRLLKQVTWNASSSCVEVALHRKVASPTTLFVRARGSVQDILRTDWLVFPQAQITLPIQLAAGQYELFLLDPPFLEQQTFDVK
jgi:hypothetical protein